MAEPRAVTTVGIAGAETDAIESALAESDVAVATGSLASVIGADPSVVVAAGDSALRALAERGVDRPILPVGTDPGFRPVEPSAVGDALSSLRAGEWRRDAHPILGVDVTGVGRRVAVLDVFLLTEEAAQISAFRVETRETDLVRVRADGLLVATPAGSVGYARAADGPIVAPGSDVVTVVPVSPFATSRDRYVVPVAPVTVHVTRDDDAIRILADGVELATVGPDRPVTVEPAGTIETVRVDDGPTAGDATER